MVWDDDVRPKRKKVPAIQVKLGSKITQAQALPEGIGEPAYELPMDNLRRAGAIYFLIRNGKVIYVGQTTIIHSRISLHIEEGKKDFDRVVFVPVAEEDLDRVEREYIAKLKPPRNLQHSRLIAT